MKTNRDGAKEYNDLPAIAAGNLFPYKISWPRITQGLRRVEMIQLFPGHYGTVTMMVEATGGRSDFHMT